VKKNLKYVIILILLLAIVVFIFKEDNTAEIADETWKTELLTTLVSTYGNGKIYESIDNRTLIIEYGFIPNGILPDPIMSLSLFNYYEYLAKYDSVKVISTYKVPFQEDTFLTEEVYNFTDTSYNICGRIIDNYK